MQWEHPLTNLWDRVGSDCMSRATLLDSCSEYGRIASSVRMQSRSKVGVAANFTCKQQA